MEMEMLNVGEMIVHLYYDDDVPFWNIYNIYVYGYISMRLN